MQWSSHANKVQSNEGSRDITCDQALTVQQHGHVFCRHTVSHAFWTMHSVYSLSTLGVGVGNALWSVSLISILPRPKARSLFFCFLCHIFFAVRLFLFSNISFAARVCSTMSC